MKTIAIIILSLYTIFNIINISWFLYKKLYKKESNLSWIKDLSLWF